MKKTTFIALIVLVFPVFVSWEKNDRNEKIFPKIKAFVTDRITDMCRLLEKGRASHTNAAKQRDLYFKTRRLYKNIEFFTEYCSFRESRLYINGPLVMKYDEDFGKKLIKPQGFQRLEELLFSGENTTDTIALNHEYRQLIYCLSEIGRQYKKLQLPDEILPDMLQLELFRIASLMLNGYDASIVKNNVQECEWIMEGLNSVTGIMEKSSRVKIPPGLNKLVARSRKFLLMHSDFDTFPRLEFIVDFINPLNGMYTQIRQNNGWTGPVKDQAVLTGQTFLFGPESFNTRYFSVYLRDTASVQVQAALGEKLFYDKTLSGNMQRSCSTCHDPRHAFTDGRSRSLAMDENGLPLRNAPGLLNVIYQRAFFYDGRAFRLEQQVQQVIHNKNEMGGDLNTIALRLKQSGMYRQLFTKAFYGTADTAITPFAIQKAIAEYEKTLVSFNSPFDHYLRGEKQAMNPREINGYNLFAGKALCGSCHFFLLFNGTVPPFYSDSEFEVIGVPAGKNKAGIDPDEGRFRVTLIPEHRHAFKTPTVRNIALTAPYMHNGIYETLEEVMDFYHRGGGKGAGIDIPNQTLPFDSLQLTETEKENIVLFMKTLTDTTCISAKKHR